MRRSPRPGSATSPHKHTPNFYSDNSNSSVSVTSGDSSGPRSAGPGPGEPEGRRARGSSCGEPALSAGVSGGTTWAGSSRQKPAPRSHNGPTACGAATVRGGASEPAGPPVVSEEQLDLLSTLDLRQEMPPPRVSKSFLSLLLQVLSVLLSLVGDVLIVVYREVCSIRFLLTAVSLLSLFLAALWWGLLYLIPPLENEPKEMLTLSEYHERVRSQGQQLQQLQAELDKLHKEVSSVRAANSERVAKLVFQRLNEDFVRKPDYALSSVGASIDLEKTSHDYEDANTAYFWNRFSFWNYARPPTVILEPDVFPGNCWAFEGDQGQVVIRLPGRVQLSDITLQHPPPSVAHTGGAKSAPRDFAVYGLQVDDETEVFLGKFTFNVEKSEIQTFHLQNDPPAAFPKVKIQILSNWGHPRFTCLYRVRAHGMRTSEGAGDNATGEPH
ncbi:sperm-associated antigen 4 protein isoform 1-T1 [Lycaon pictus]|uniref:Sperm associated antigen 4 n=1 Tax=Canis lupus familiaris TaxID=9615 RepID=A0A8I3P9R7_CANLF|nr:sperm-associated antigen 4 protein isoform X2 [Canis lupus dingo]XP_038289576.1 sperm-associated antigen 4 protein isoform X2 [Canis lupus familiaris]XP_038428062.1 sperm-associated antigen 4 protein isoform X2 [Canis lupus familiaris]XP_542978.2 sperm-associated antigen 4 protein isoform X2 [Canis lupus familiaris]|eukprot:XP_542978.2 sperm-associated antigen 4 protein isoform X2 [Canis lupus familiaris]